MIYYHMGQCRPCKRRFRWPARELALTDARCMGCDGPLIRAAGASRRGSGVEEVDAAWVKAPVPPETPQAAPQAIDPQDPTTWPSPQAPAPLEEPQAAPQALDPQDPATWPFPMAMRRGQRRKARRGGRRATDRQDPLDRLLADMAQVPGPAADE